MLQDEQNLWNIFFSILFALGAYISYQILLSHGARDIATIPLFDAVILIFATFRVTRLFVYDHITQFVRDVFLDVRKIQEGHYMREKPAIGPRRTGAMLFGCPWCFGVWSAFVVAFFYFLSPHAWFFLFVLALAGAGTLLQLFANMLGWSAEGKKRSVTHTDVTGQHSGTCG